MADVLPDRVIAGSGGTPANMNVLYGRHGDGRSWHKKDYSRQGTSIVSPELVKSAMWS